MNFGKVREILLKHRLDTGKLLFTAECGCAIIEGSNGVDVIYCCKHAAAPDMYEALGEAKLQLEYLGDKFTKTGTGECVLARIVQARAKAEGKGEEMKDHVYEGDICPECGEGKIVPTSYEPLCLKCDNCGATYNDRGERVPCDNATV